MCSALIPSLKIMATSEVGRCAMRPSLYTASPMHSLPRKNSSFSFVVLFVNVHFASICVRHVFISSPSTAAVVNTKLLR